MPAKTYSQTACGSLIAAWAGADAETSGLVEPILGVTMLICGLASTATAINRWIVAHRALASRAAEPVVRVVEPVPPPAPALARSAPELRSVARH